MATTAPDEQRYTFTVPAIQRSIARLANERSHEQLPGYLALLRLGAAQGQIDADAADIHAFYRDYLEVPGAPERKPFLQPFRSRGSGVRLTNKNTSGSYSEASIREGKPLSHVLEIVTSNVTSSHITYRLKSGHEQAVISEMLAGHRIPAVALAAVLLRDRLLSLNPEEPRQVIDILRGWLRIRPEDEGGDAVFDTIFSDDSAEYASSDFEVYEG